MEKDISEELQKCFDLDVYAALIYALEKQMLYKPKWYKTYLRQCKCGAVLLNRSTKYCGNCGQRLDWRD
jgi:hypothetical protein